MSDALSDSYQKILNNVLSTERLNLNKIEKGNTQRGPHHRGPL